MWSMTDKPFSELIFNVKANKESNAPSKPPNKNALCEPCFLSSSELTQNDWYELYHVANIIEYNDIIKQLPWIFSDQD